MATYYQSQPASPRSRRTSITVFPDKEPDPKYPFGNKPVAAISWKKGGAIPNFDERGDPTWEYDEHYKAQNPPQTDEYGWEVDDYDIEPPSTLFHFASPSVESLFADKHMRPHVTTLLGSVLSHAQMWGVPIEASADLSAHSSNIVRQGMDAGLVVGARGNPDADVTNDLGNTPAHEYDYRLYEDNYRDSHKVVPEAEVNEWRRAGREAVTAVRGRKKKAPARPESPARPAPVGEQLRLDL